MACKICTASISRPRTRAYPLAPTLFLRQSLPNITGVSKREGSSSSSRDLVAVRLNHGWKLVNQSLCSWRKIPPDSKGSRTPGVWVIHTNPYMPKKLFVRAFHWCGQISKIFPLEQWKNFSCPMEIFLIFQKRKKIPLILRKDFRDLTAPIERSPRELSKDIWVCM